MRSQSSSSGDNFYIIELMESHIGVLNHYVYIKHERRYCFEMDGFYVLPDRQMDTIPFSKAKKLYKITFDDVGSV